MAALYVVVSVLVYLVPFLIAFGTLILLVGLAVFWASVAEKTSKSESPDALPELPRRETYLAYGGPLHDTGGYRIVSVSSGSTKRLMGGWLR